MYAPRRKTAFVSDLFKGLETTTTSLVEPADVLLWMSWQNLNIEARFTGPKSSQKGTYLGKTFSNCMNEMLVLLAKTDDLVASSETCSTISNLSFDISGTTWNKLNLFLSIIIYIPLLEQKP